ncbi:MAG: hypothetical protein JWQ86_3558 [Mycobacterium sp.]|jgi:hypothetical protein|nr:hypothetical protein [Mycobacterium sp.]MDT5217285.1 hypothetical protein [Mycobacterium sp.]
MWQAVRSHPVAASPGDTRQSNYWPIAAAISSGLTSRTGWPSDQ